MKTDGSDDMMVTTDLTYIGGYQKDIWREFRGGLYGDGWTRHIIIRI